MNQYYSKSLDELFTNLKTSESGLSKFDVKRRIEKYGLNTIPRKEKKGLLSIFIGQIIDPIVLLLFIAVTFSFITGEVVDGISILVIIFVDLIIGTYEENKANKVIDSLQKLVPVSVKVIRDSKEIEIDISELVIGDIVLLESGDKISSDMRIIEAHNLTVDESVLTGESIPITKNSDVIREKDVPINSQTNMLFAGCNIVTGRGRAIVVGTGINTEIGKIANTINNSKEEKSPLTIRMEKFSKQISAFIVIFSCVLIVLLYLKGFKLNEILITVIALAISALPEGLPLALTMALTIASNKMAKKKVVAKKLYSVEALGSCTVIASDKTGTLTVNEQTAKRIVLPNDLEYEITGAGYNTNGSVIGQKLELAREIATLGVINNEATLTKENLLGDKIDLAFLVLGQKLRIKEDVNIIDSIPYESSNGYSAVFYEENNKTYCTIKGSLEVVSKFSNSINFLKTNSFNKIYKQNEELSKDGYRVISIAYGEVPKKSNYTEKDIKNLKFMGLVGFIDPIRKEAIKAINDSINAGVKVLMITGDHPLTAFKIAKDLKLTNSYDEVTTSDEIRTYLKKSDREFDDFVKRKKVFARVSSLEKLKIVESLKRQGEFVAVTGDGVNDALALQSANIGVSMGSGTDIAKDTSKIILLDDNFKSIVNAIFEGRVAYSNIRKITYFLLSCGLAEVLFFTLSILFNMPIPLLAIQLLWLNVVTDGIQDIALSFEKGDKSLLTNKYHNPRNGLFDRKMISEILVSGITIGLIVFGLWIYLINYKKIDVNVARTYVMALMIIIQNSHAFNCRSEDKSIGDIPLFSNKVFLFGIIGSVLLGISVIQFDFFNSFLKTTGLPMDSLSLVFALGLTILLVMEIYKKIKKN
jgi:calcium-translocating P-type ATPase